MEEGWVPADELKPGMHVRQADGDYELVWLKWNVRETQEMYNLTVDEAHTYYVGDGQWLVHNDCWTARFEAAVGRPRHPDHELHHGFPRKFVDWFESKGIDIHDPENMLELPKDLHTRKPDGIHTGPFEDSWNGKWAIFKEDYGNASPSKVYEKLAELAREFGIEKYRGGVQ